MQEILKIFKGFLFALGILMPEIRWLLASRILQRFLGSNIEQVENQKAPRGNFVALVEV